MAFGAQAAFAAKRRPIEGAVATMGVSDRVSFLRKTYAHLGASLVLFALFTAGMMRYATELSLHLSLYRPSGMGWALLMVAVFIVGTIAAQRLAMSESSRALQYVGLAISVVVWSLLAQGVIWFVVEKFGNPREVFAGGHMNAALSPKAALVIGEATVATLAIFVGLTVAVFVTRKDFSFLGSFLRMAMFGLLAMGLICVLFGFNIGIVYSVIFALLMCGYILYETSLVMNYVRPTQHVAAAVMLFTTVVSLFIQILQILAETQRR